METVAENEYTLTKKLFFEAMRRMDGENYTPAVKKSLIVIALLWAVLAFVTFRAGGHVAIIVLELLVVLALAWTLLRSIPGKRSKRAWDTLCERSGGDLTRHIRFVEDRMEVAPGDLIINYEDVEKVLETQHMLIIVTDGKKGVMVLKDGFTKGDGDAVKALINEWRK